MDNVQTKRRVIHGSQKKVKTGCRTCKLRKIKCDESWPVCRRCQSSGRHCDGYGVWGGGALNSDPPDNGEVVDMTRWAGWSAFPLGIRPQTIKPLTLPQDELRCFEWYMRRSCVKLPGLFRSENWTTLVFQASTREPSIRHAVLALASAHQEEVKGASSLFYEPNHDQSRFTVYQYSKAIAALQPSLSDFQSSSLRITLITCAFFVYSDFLRGHYKRGLVHLRHGLNLIPSLGVSALEQDPSCTLVDGWIVTILTRLLVQAKLLGQRLRTPCQDLLDPGLQSDHVTFRSIHHARRSLEHILLQVFCLEHEALQQSQTGMTVRSRDLLINRQKIAQLELQKWRQVLDATMDRLPVQRNTQSFLERFSYQLLQLYHRVAIIFADACVEVFSERRFDCHETIFLEIVTKSIEIHKTTHPNGKLNPKGLHDPEASSPSSISDIGWIAPLYVTAIKCRNHRLRHQAVKLLASSLHREGIWDSNLAVAVAQRVIEIEEGDFYGHLTGHYFDLLDLPTDTDLATPTLPEQSRLRIVDLILPEDRAGRLRLRCFRKADSMEDEWTDQEFDLCTRRWTDTDIVSHAEADLAGE